jgi:hypothetical protein
VFLNASADVPPSGTNARSSIERRGIRLGYEIIAIFPGQSFFARNIQTGL